jgi:hypothetical protein
MAIIIYGYFIKTKGEQYMKTVDELKIGQIATDGKGCFAKIILGEKKEKVYGYFETVGVDNFILDKAVIVKDLKEIYY